MSDAFKQLDVCDVLEPGLIARFERRREVEDTIIITIPARHMSHAQFHLDAGTLRLIAEVLQFSPSAKEIAKLNHGGGK